MGRNLQRLEAAVAAWNEGDLDGYLGLYDDAIRLHGYGPEPMDRHGVAGFYRAVWAALPAEGRPGPALEILDAVEEGDRLAVRFAQTGTQTGAFLGVPASGRPYRLEGLTLLRFGDGGRVVERHSSADMLGLLVQLGALPPPG